MYVYFNSRTDTNKIYIIIRLLWRFFQRSSGNIGLVLIRIIGVSQLFKFPPPIPFNSANQDSAVCEYEINCFITDCLIMDACTRYNVLL